MNREELRIDSFLRFGYFCDYEEQHAPIDFSSIDKKLYEKEAWEDLIILGAEKLTETFSGLWQEGREHVLPLSGGLDSRLIFAALLKHINAEQLQTFTFGAPGSYDYEIGNAIAAKFGTRHHPISLGRETYSLETELLAAKRTDYQGVLFHHPPLDMLDQNYPDGLFWSGYVGDAVAGSYLEAQPSATLREAQMLHLRHRVLVKSTRLHRCADRDFLACMRQDHIDPEMLTLDEQVLFNEAAPKFTAPLVLFSGYEFVTPFINTPWMDFMLSVPNRYRFRQELMIEISRRTFPRLFNLPSRNRLGHTFDSRDFVVKGTFWLNRVRKAVHQFFPRVNSPNFQYSDFDEGVRSDSNLRRVVEESIENLRYRGICDWIDFDGIWRRHDRRIRNHGDALIVLASLELILKARETEQQV